ncbi:hypothetical protein [Polaromonas naphthalenivorans]|nr:hypothetical protein [Polaromonas naphthalenivorans]
MKLFSNTRAKRSTAFMVLLVWLFALASGLANACLLQAQETHSHGIATAEFSGIAHAPAPWPAHAGAVASHGDDSHASTAPCLKVCDEGSRSVPKPDLKVAQTDPGPAPLLVVLWTAAAPVVPALGQMDDMQPATPGLPLRVRYSRLAL